MTSTQIHNLSIDFPSDHHLFGVEVMYESRDRPCALNSTILKRWRRMYDGTDQTIDPNHAVLRNHSWQHAEHIPVQKNGSLYGMSLKK